MLTKLVILTAAAITMTTAATAVASKAAPKGKKLCKAFVKAEKPAPKSSVCLSEPTAEAYGMDYMFI